VDAGRNFTLRGFAYTVCDIGIAYRENVEDAKRRCSIAYPDDGQTALKSQK